MAYDASRAQLLRHLARRYQAGAALDELAPMAGCSARTLAARLREIGVAIRLPGRRGHLGNDASAIAPFAARGRGAKMPTRLDAHHWRASAEQMRGWAEWTNDPETRRIMRRIAAGYDKLANNIEEREARQRQPIACP